MRGRFACALAALVLVSCTSVPKPQTPPVAPSGKAAEAGPENQAEPTRTPAAPKATATAPATATSPAAGATSARPGNGAGAGCQCQSAEKAPAITWANSLRRAQWSDLPQWNSERAEEAMSAFIKGCARLNSQAAWRAACIAAEAADRSNSALARRFFESNFEPYAVVNADGTIEGQITGYYEAALRGSRKPDATYRYALYAPPEDMLSVELGDLYPELKGMRLRGRLDGKRVVPYFSRSEIDAGKASSTLRELLFTDDAIDLFFLQVQGSGRITLDGGEVVRVSYADQNGHPYKSIGRLLVERGELTLDQASMQGIRAWGARNPQKLPALLNENPSYVFFRELPATGDGPPGALGAPLTAGRSIAVDPRAVPLGAPVFLATTEPNSSVPLNRLMVAQDTGGAIKGAVRADFYWGSGAEAAQQAGRMRQRGQMWVLLPKGFVISAQ